VAKDENERIADALRKLAGEEVSDPSAHLDHHHRDGDEDAHRAPVVRPLEPRRPTRPERPVRPPPPGARAESIVPAQAPKPSLDPAGPPSSPPPASTPPAQSEPSGLDRIIEGEDDLVAMPAPSEEMLLEAALRHRSPASRPRKARSFRTQRTLIPILLTLALLLPAFGVWLIRRPAESELRLYGQRLMIYLLVGGLVFLVLAVINMIQVHGALRAQTAAERSGEPHPSR
jgi:hypothetical protein